MHPKTRLSLLASALAVAVVVTPAPGITDLHLNEITEGIVTYVDGRIAVLDSLPSLDKAQKKERRSLAKLQRKAGKDVFSLKKDFSELKLAGKTASKLGPAGDAMQDSLDEAYALADRALTERDELVNDHLALVPAAKASPRDKVLKQQGKFNDARSVALAGGDNKVVAASWAKAEKFATKALKLAEKAVLRAGNPLPPLRYRSGDKLGPAGGRVAIPRNSTDMPNLAGANLVFHPGALQPDTTITLTEESTDIVGGDDVPVGPVLGVDANPDNPLNGRVTVTVPFTLPQDANASDLALFHDDGQQVTGSLDVEVNADGTLSGSTTSLSKFQAGLLAPPVGTPNGVYHVQMFSVVTSLPTQDTPGAHSFGVIEQDYRFRADGTGTTTVGSFPVVTRRFEATTPHHQDVGGASISGSFDFVWQFIEEGRFEFNFPAGGAQAAARGVVSTDGRVMAFSGRGGEFEFLAVGVKGSASPVAADLTGRWLVVEIGAELQNPGANPPVTPFTTPFTTRISDALTSFTSDGVDTLTFDANGVIQHTDITYNTDLATAAHTRTTPAEFDGGTEDYSLLPGGRFQGASLARSGWFDGEAGVLVTTRFDDSTRSVSFQVATRKPLPPVTGAFEGTFRFVNLELGSTVGAPSAFTSTHDTFPGAGTLTVPPVGDASYDVDATDRAIYTLAGPPPLGDIKWTLQVATAPIAASSTPFTLALDGNGNHTPGLAERVFGVSEDGGVLLGSVLGEPVREARGILVGFK